MISVERGLEMVNALTQQLEQPNRMPSELVSLSESLNRVLREDISADADSPRFDKAIRDGFAVRHEDLAAPPAILRVIGESRAGFAAGIEVVHGTCCEIMTGAPLPAGA